MSRFPHVLEQAKRRESKACFLLSGLLVVIGSLRYPQTMGGELLVVCGIIICVYFLFFVESKRSSSRSQSPLGFLFSVWLGIKCSHTSWELFYLKGRVKCGRLLACVFLNAYMLCRWIQNAWGREKDLFKFCVFFFCLSFLENVWHYTVCRTSWESTGHSWA